MFRGKKAWASITAGCLVVGIVGCKGEDSPKPPEDEQPAVVEPAANGNPGETVADTPVAVQVPEVQYTETEGKTHLLKVGDIMPDVDLPDAKGDLHKMSSLYGANLTFIVFWKDRNLYSVAEFEDLEGDVAAPYADRGVQVIAVNEGDTPETVVALIQRTEAKFANLLDPEGKLFAEIATGKIPRTYAVDATGRILWFDWEYSPSTRRAIQQTVEAVLGESTPAEDESPAP